jgi:hypothetical protein
MCVLCCAVPCRAAAAGMWSATVMQCHQGAMCRTGGATGRLRKKKTDSCSLNECCGSGLWYMLPGGGDGGTDLDCLQHTWWLLGIEVAVGDTCSPWETLGDGTHYQDLICWGLM